MRIIIGIMVGLLLMKAAAPEHASSDSRGCGEHGARTGAFTVKATDGAGRSRKYLLQVPAGYVPSHAYPLVFVFHGAGGSSRDSYSWGLQNAAGAADHGIFVFPEGIGFHDYGVGWDDSATGYDLPFFDNMVRDISAGYCIDAGRLFVAGFSWGGDFVTTLACQRGDKVRAVAANSTNDEFKDTANYLTYQGLPCGTGRHPAVRFEHAEKEDAQYPAPDFETTSRLFRYLNSCSAATTIKPNTRGLACAAYNGCAADYVECSFDHALGHTLPPNWPQDTWDFFSSFP